MYATTLAWVGWFRSCCSTPTKFQINIAAKLTTLYNSLEDPPSIKFNQSTCSDRGAAQIMVKSKTAWIRHAYPCLLITTETFQLVEIRNHTESSHSKKNWHVRLRQLPRPVGEPSLANLCPHWAAGTLVSIILGSRRRSDTTSTEGYLDICSIQKISVYNS